MIYICFISNLFLIIFIIKPCLTVLIYDKGMSSHCNNMELHFDFLLLFKSKAFDSIIFINLTLSSLSTHDFLTYQKESFMTFSIVFYGKVMHLVKLSVFNLHLFFVTLTSFSNLSTRRLCNGPQTIPFLF